tara:strand:+ start:57 stop:614 length:558 start_codon:yes stop_codon:yes gene_type:complete
MSRDLVWKHTLECHSQIKSNLLDLISDYEQINPSPDYVTKTDFYDNLESFPEYFNVLSQNLTPLWDEICHKYWAGNFGIMGVWFQQYNNNDFHGWHFHGNSSISMSYFVELDDAKYSTEFVDIQKKDTFQMECSEGDVIIFPSYIIHRSPLIRSDTRKTTIAINLNLGDVDLNKVNPIDPIFNYE